MSVLVLSDVFPPQTGGSGRWLWEVYSRATGFARNAVVMAGEHAEAEAFDQTHSLNVHRVPLAFPSWGVMGLTSLGRYWRIYRKAMKLVKQHNLRSVHCGRCLPEGLVAWAINRRIGLPYAVYVHGEELNTLATSRELTFLGRRVFNGADLLVVNSKNTGELLAKRWGVGGAKIEVIHPGVDTSKFKQTERDEKVREQFGWAGRPVVLTVGRLQERKGHHCLIEALPEIVKVLPDVLYSIVGEGARRVELEKQIARLGLRKHVQFMGERTDDELVQCYQQCDVFALPNIDVNGDFEGFGMVLVEAQACGKPVIAGLSGGTGETMRVDRDGTAEAKLATGFLVNCHDARELAKVISSVLVEQETRDSMGQAARAWAVEQFDWTNHVGRIEQAFEYHLGEKQDGTEFGSRQHAVLPELERTQAVKGNKSKRRAA